MFRAWAAACAITLTVICGSPAVAEPTPQDVLRTWYKLALALVRHTPTYSPPVASRSLAYLGVTAYEAVASGDPTMVSLAGQLNGLTAGPSRTADAARAAPGLRSSPSEVASESLVPSSARVRP